jgi:cation diffusion facilitator family transporter
MAALGSVASALVLVSLKVFLAVVTGSLGILSEALHSSLDLITTVITYLSVRISDQPADSKHTYGHGKVENFSAFVETGLLLLASVYIIWEAFHRMLTREVHIQPSLLAVGVLGLTIVIDVVRSRALTRVAKKYQSEALEADALHFSTDVWSTVVVMFGMVVVWLGQRWGIEWLSYADPIAALVVSAVIIRVGSRLGKRTIDALLDAAPAGLQQRIAAAVEELEGVLAAERVRVRRAGNRHFVDVTISVPRTASFEQVHATSEAVEQRVTEIVPADVMVHMEPRAAADENLFDAIRAVAQRRGLQVHEIAAHQLDGRLYVALHLEVDQALTLRAAHRRATELEEEIRRLPALTGDEGRPAAGADQVNIHIEPLGTQIVSADDMNELSGAVREHINGLQSHYREVVNCHEVNARRVDGKVVVTCHCAMDGGLPIGRVHDVTEALQDRVKEKFPQIFEVNIHPEPLEES